MTTTTYVLGAGCFWCLDAIYRKTRGVSDVVSVYTGGHVSHPTYEQVCSCLLYTSPSPRDKRQSRMPSSA